MFDIPCLQNKDIFYNSKCGLVFVVSRVDGFLVPQSVRLPSYLVTIQKLSLFAKIKTITKGLNKQNFYKRTLQYIQIL